MLPLSSFYLSPWCHCLGDFLFMANLGIFFIGHTTSPLSLIVKVGCLRIQELPLLASSHKPPGGSKEKQPSVTLIKSVGKREGVILIVKPTLYNTNAWNIIDSATNQKGLSIHNTSQVHKTYGILTYSYMLAFAFMLADSRVPINRQCQPTVGWCVGQDNNWCTGQDHISELNLEAQHTQALSLWESLVLRFSIMVLQPQTLLFTDINSCHYPCLAT